MFPCQIPPPLTPGDRLWVTMPSGRLRDRTVFDHSIELWRSRGYEVELSPAFDAAWGYLAGTDTQRRQGLRQGFESVNYQGILCGRGGYGGARVLEDWQWNAPDRKWLIGFSDITTLLWSYAQAKISGLHGPVLTTLAEEPEWSLERLWDWVEGRSVGPLEGNAWGNGLTEGYLLPCNLTVATHLLGTPIAPDLSNVILAIEDVGEAPYRIDRMLTHWRMSGAIQRVKGIAIGRFSQVDPDPDGFSVEDVLRDRLSDLGIPIVSDLPFGHDGPNAVLPVGVRAALDGDRGSLSVYRS